MRLMICQSLKDCLLIDLREYKPDATVLHGFRWLFTESWGMAVFLMRMSQYMHQRRFVWRFAPYVKRINEILTGLECHLSATIKEGLFLPHTQNIVIGEGVKIQKKVTIYNGVTLGAFDRKENESFENRYPTICENAVIYTGAKVLGPIEVGAGAKVGANAVVLKTVPQDYIAVGVPARILPQKKKKVDQYH